MIAGRKIAWIMATITEFVRADQPGYVRCHIVDVKGRTWSFVEKVPIVSDQDLDGKISYPQPGMIACEITGVRKSKNGETWVLVDTAMPYGIEAEQGGYAFVVLETQLAEGPFQQRPG